MKYAEKKISLVGWGEEQVMLHTINGRSAFSLVENNRVSTFGFAPWLKGLIAVIPALARYKHGTAPAPEHVEMVLAMRQSAVSDAVEAMRTKDIYLLAEAVSTTYMAQQYMGAELLPGVGEIAKRFAGQWGVYVFPTPKAVHKELRKHSILVA